MSNDIKPVVSPYIDLAARILATCLFGWAAFVNTAHIHPAAIADADAKGAVGTLAGMAGVIFLASVAIMMMIRTAPIAASQGWRPKLIALCGTYASVPIALLPLTPLPLWASWLSLLLIFVGSIGCVVSALTLGRSFSIFPQARRLVTHGVYRYIRHPLYISETICALGIFVQHAGFAAAALMMVYAGLQIKRARYEDELLAITFNS